MTDATLWDYASEYPNAPGFRRARTSRAAAEAMKVKDKPLRVKVLELLKAGNELTADEIADRLGETVLAIRPRVSQIKRQGLIFDTGKTRPNISGIRASVWSAF